MRFAALLGLLVLLSPTLVLAGPNERGVLLLHAAPSLAYRRGVSYCGLSVSTAWFSAVASVIFQALSTRHVCLCAT